VVLEVLSRASEQNKSMMSTFFSTKGTTFPLSHCRPRLLCAAEEGRTGLGDFQHASLTQGETRQRGREEEKARSRFSSQRPSLIAAS
jgi:hypothetical protein